MQMTNSSHLPETHTRNISTISRPRRHHHHQVIVVIVIKLTGCISEPSTAKMSILTRDMTDFESDFESVGFRRFFTTTNPSDLQARFLLDSDLIFVLARFGR